MSLTVEQTVDIQRLVSLHGHLSDIRDFQENGGEFAAVFTDDIVYDMDALGHGTVRGRKALSEAARALGDVHPAGHHVTNVLVTETPAGEIHVRSKFLAINTDGTTGTGVYEDTVTETPDGWRITHRSILPPTAPMRG